MIRIKPFDIVALLDYRGIQAPNQHGRVKITALINSKKEAEYLGMANKTTWAEVIGIDENQKETPIFCGVLTVFNDPVGRQTASEKLSVRESDVQGRN